jgi:parvulin-like peptidyl-prolyl isomerase
MQRQVVLAAILAGVMVPAGFAQQAPAPKAAAPAAAKPAKKAEAAKSPVEGPEKVVLKVGNEKFTQADMQFLIDSLSPQLQQAVARQGKKPLGDQYAIMSVLSQQAEKDHLDSTLAFRQQMALHRLQALAQAEYDKMAEDIKVTPEEVSTYYKSHASEFDEAQIREVIIRKKPEGAKEDSPGLPAQEAESRAQEIRKELAGGTDPKQVAEKFSQENTVMIDAEPRTIRHGQLIAALDKAAFDLKEGAISDPLETPQALAFLQVVSRTHSEMKDVSKDIENTLHQEKVQAALDELKKKTPIWMDEEYFKSPSETAPAPASSPQPQK